MGLISQLAWLFFIALLEILCGNLLGKYFCLKSFRFLRSGDFLRQQYNIVMGLISQLAWLFFIASLEIL